MAITKIQSESMNLADTYAFTGTVTGAGEKNTPAFFASVGSAQSVATGTVTKLTLSNEIIDTDNCYDASTNYRFTPNVAGKYYVFAQYRWETSDNFDEVDIHIRKNGSSLVSANFGNIHFDTISTSGVVDMNGSSDYLEAYCYQGSGSNKTVTTHSHINVFGGYLIST